MRHLWHALALGLALSTSAAAQTPTDGLATCLAQHTSAADRQAMARWVFVTLASHPDLTPYASAQASQETGRIQANMAQTLTRLMTGSSPRARARPRHGASVPAIPSVRIHVACGDIGGDGGAVSLQGVSDSPMDVMFR